MQWLCVDCADVEAEQLPGEFSVWAASPAARFLHGKFVWANWDVDEMTERKDEIARPGMLQIGLQGAELVDIRTIFSKVDQRRNEQ